jgi:sulfonate transport system substrate-binding protein
MIRLALAAGLLLGSAVLASAQTTLRVGDQKGNSQAVMEAAGVLKDVPTRSSGRSFPAAAPLLEALGAGAIETGLVGDAPFTFAAAANVPVKAIAAVRQSRDGLAVLVPEQSPIKSFDDLRGKKIATGRGSIGHQLILAALEARDGSPDDVTIAFLAPSDCQGRLHARRGRCMVDLGTLCQPGRCAVQIPPGHHRRGPHARPRLSGRHAHGHQDKRPELEDFVRRLAGGAGMVRRERGKLCRDLGQAHEHSDSRCRSTG